MNIVKRLTECLYIGTICFLLGSYIEVITAAEKEPKTGGDTAGFVVPAGQKQLFLDDYGIAKIENLTASMHTPDKKGAVITPDQSWETSLQTRSAPAWDPNLQLFKLWMIGSGGTSFAVSKDGIHWTKPVLRQVEINGSLENNLVSVEPNLKWPANAIENVIYDPDDPDHSRRFKGLGHCYGREPIVSADGIQWFRLKVPALASQDESNLSYDRETHTFIATVKHTGPHGRSVFLSTSRDFENWTKPELIFSTDDLDLVLARKNIEERLANPALNQPMYNNPADYNADVYNMGVFRYEGLYIGLPAIYHSTGKADNNTDGFHLVQLVCSRDLKIWKRLGDRRPFIGPSPVDSGAYDLTQILPPSFPIMRGNELWFYYTGIKYRYPPQDADLKTGAICLAVLRRDGFISLDAGTEEGTLVTKPFVLSGEKLYVNTAASQGWLQVEVVGADGNTRAASEHITCDQTREEVKWRNGTLKDLKGKTITLKFTLKNASFYSYWFEEFEE